MPLDLSNRFVVAVSTRALFDLSKENQIFEEHGLEEYESHQRKNEATVLSPGTAFPLVKKLFELNDFLPPHRQVEVVFFSRNSATTSLRAWKSAEYHQLPITRGAFTSGRSVAKYADDYHVDLLLSAESRDVDEALRMHIPAALVMGRPRRDIPTAGREIRIAFDGDAVLFDGTSEQIYQTSGIEAFQANEKHHAHEPLGRGPMATLMTSIAILKRTLPEAAPRIVIGLITARNGPAQERVIRTLSRWRMEIDETHFLGGLSKAEVLQTFGADIFFDDQMIHCAPASDLVPTCQVRTDHAADTAAMMECPNCKSPMVKRKARQGRNSGKAFYGCSRFPKCRRTVSIP